MVDADFGIFDRIADFNEAAQRFARAFGIAVDEEADEIHNVVVGAREPILQRQEIGAHVLRGARNEFQQARNPAQHFHLLGAGDARLLGLAAQFFQKRAQTTAGMGGETPHARELCDLASGHGDNHCIARIAPRLKRWQHALNVVFHKQHGGDDDIGFGDVFVATLQRERIFAPLSSRMQR